MAGTHSTSGRTIPAAAYIRMSGRTQEKSPAEQRAELVKLAAREGCEVVAWLSDEAISGDTSTDGRPGLAALLRGAQAGDFSTVLAWHTNRLSREDPMDALVFYNQLRKARVGLMTCCEGRIDQAAEEVVGELWGLLDGFSQVDPAVVREVFRRLVHGIECRWELDQGRKSSCRLVGGVVYLRDPRLIVTCAGNDE